MQDDERRPETLREIDRLEGLLDRALPLLRIGGGKFVAIGRRSRDLDRERTEVVQTGELDFAGLEHFLDSWHERNADAVAQFDAIEAEILDLAQHFVAGGVAAGVPAGGERDHELNSATASQSCHPEPRRRRGTSQRSQITQMKNRLVRQSSIRDREAQLRAIFRDWEVPHRLRGSG